MAQADTDLRSTPADVPRLLLQHAVAQSLAALAQMGDRAASGADDALVALCEKAARLLAAIRLLHEKADAAPEAARLRAALLRRARQEHRRWQSTLERIAATPSQGAAGQRAKAGLIEDLAAYDELGRPDGTPFERMVGSLALDLIRPARGR